MITLARSTRIATPHVLFVYLAKAFLLRFAILLVGVSVILLMLDLLATSDDILAPEGAGVSSLLRYMELRLPQLASMLVPFTGLLATLITFAGLNQHSEITVMKAAGLSAFQIIAPLTVVSGLIGVAHFMFNETVLVEANIELEFWRDHDYALEIPATPENANKAWASEAGAYIGVQGVAKGGTILDRVTLYRSDGEGALKQMVTAKFAAFADGKWTLFDVTSFSVDSHKVVKTPVMAWETSLKPERFLALGVEPSKVPFSRLVETTRSLKAEGHSVSLLAAWIHQKIAGPASNLLMPLLGSMAGFGVYRAGLLFLRVIGGMGLGFSFFVADNLLLALGQFGTLPPFLAAWSPFALFLFIGLGLVVFTEE